GTVGDHDPDLLLDEAPERVRLVHRPDPEHDARASRCSDGVRADHRVLKPDEANAGRGGLRQLTGARRARGAERPLRVERPGGDVGAKVANPTPGLGLEGHYDSGAGEAMAIEDREHLFLDARVALTSLVGLDLEQHPSLALGGDAGDLVKSR